MAFSGPPISDHLLTGAAMSRAMSMQMCGVPVHLQDHSYWSRMRTSTNKMKHSAAESRKRKREEDSSSRALEEPPERRLCERAAVLATRSPSPRHTTPAQQPCTSAPEASTPAPQASLEGVQLEIQQGMAGEGQQEIQPGPLQQSVWPGAYSPEPVGLSPSAYNTVVETLMAWILDSPFNPEMASIPSLCGDSASDEQQQPIKRRRMLGPGEQQRLATEVCDTILIHAKERFSFTQHLISATLLHGKLFPQHSVKLPDTALETTVEAYPMLNKAKLKTELSLLACSGAVHFHRDCQPPQDLHHHTHDNS